MRASRDARHGQAAVRTSPRALRAPLRAKPVASTMIVATPSVEPAGADAVGVRQFAQGRIVHRGRHRRRGALAVFATVFRARAPLYSAAHDHPSGVGRAASVACSRYQGTLGHERERGEGDAAPSGDDDGSPAVRGAKLRASGARRLPGAPNGSSLDESAPRGRARFGGCGGGLPGRAAAIAHRAWAVVAVRRAVADLTSFHSISPGQRGVVTHFGRYSSDAGPGVSFTLPSPIDRVQKIDVENIRNDRHGLRRQRTT